MQFSLATSILALTVSEVSLSFSIYFNLRDRGKLVVSSFLSPDSDYSTTYLGIVVVNAGRRPVVIRMWVAANEDGGWVGTLWEKVVKVLDWQSMIVMKYS